MTLRVTSALRSHTLVEPAMRQAQGWVPALKGLRNCGVLWLCLLLLGSPGANARVVINEIFYHAPADIEDLEYVELYNSGDQAVDLSGWTFTKGIKFKFVSGARIE